MKNWLVVDAIIAGIALILLGFYYFKANRDSWVRSSNSGIEFPEWFSYLYSGAVFLFLSVVLVLVVP